MCEAVSLPRQRPSALRRTRHSVPPAPWAPDPSAGVAPAVGRGPAPRGRSTAGSGSRGTGAPRSARRSSTRQAAVTAARPSAVLAAPPKDVPYTSSTAGTRGAAERRPAHHLAHRVLRSAGPRALPPSPPGPAIPAEAGPVILHGVVRLGALHGVMRPGARHRPCGPAPGTPPYGPGASPYGPTASPYGSGVSAGSVPAGRRGRRRVQGRVRMRRRGRGRVRGRWPGSRTQGLPGGAAVGGTALPTRARRSGHCRALRPAGVPLAPYARGGGCPLAPHARTVAVPLGPQGARAAAVPVPADPIGVTLRVGRRAFRKLSGGRL